jgi:hypothetical protein
MIDPVLLQTLEISIKCGVIYKHGRYHNPVIFGQSYYQSYPELAGCVLETFTVSFKFED